MKTRKLLAVGTMATLLVACADDYNVAPTTGINDANRPSAGQVTLTVAGDADTRAVWDDESLKWEFGAEDKIAALLMDEWNETNEGHTTIRDYSFLDYIHTNYPFSTTDGEIWSTPDDAALCEGNYFFVWPYDGTYKVRGHVGFGLKNAQKNVDETGEYDLWASVKENQKYLGYAFIPATTADVNNVDVTFHPIFATPKFKLQNVSGMSLRLVKLIVRTHQEGPADSPALLPDSVVLAPLSKNFKDVNVAYANGELDNDEETAALFSHATLVQNGFFAQTPADDNIEIDPTKGVYEYTVEFGDDYIVPAGEFFKACAVMPAGEYHDFDIYALVEEQNSEKTTGVVCLSSLKTANWTGFDSQNGSVQTVLKPGIQQVFSANFDAEALQNLSLENFTVANSEDLAWILNLKAEYGGKDLVVIKTLGDQVEMTQEVYDLLAAESRKGIKVQIDGTIVIPAGIPTDAIDQLTTGQARVKTTIINKGTQELEKDLVNCDVINYGNLTGNVSITGDVSNAESGVIDITTVTGDVENAGNLTIKTINGNLENGYNATVETVNGDVNNYDNGGELVINNVTGTLTNSGKVTVMEGTLANVVNGGSSINPTITIEEETVINVVLNNRWGTINVNADAQIGGNNYGTINIAEGVTLTPYQYLNNESDSDGAFFGIINVNDADLKYIGSTTIKNNGVIYVKGKSHVAVNSGYGIIDVTEADATGGYQASSNATTAQVAGMTTYFRYRITTENNSKSVTTATLQKIISSKNYGINPIILEFEADATQAGLSGANVDKILVKSGATLSLEGEWWLENTQQPQVYMMGDSYNALEVEEGATLQILNGKTLKAGQAFTATVDGKMRAENASKVQGDVTIDGTGVVEVATADFSWTKGTFSGDWTK